MSNLKEFEGPLIFSKFFLSVENQKTRGYAQWKCLALKISQIFQKFEGPLKFFKFCTKSENSLKFFNFFKNLRVRLNFSIFLNIALSPKIMIVDT